MCVVHVRALELPTFIDLYVCFPLHIDPNTPINYISRYYGHEILGSKCYVFMEHLPAGSLSDVLGKYPMSERLCGTFHDSSPCRMYEMTLTLFTIVIAYIARYVYQMLSGLQYLHSNGPCLSCQYCFFTRYIYTVGIFHGYLKASSVRTTRYVGDISFAYS